MKTYLKTNAYPLSLLASFLIILAVTVFCSGCASIKKTTDSNVKTHIVANVDSTATMQKITETKFFGDTLKGNAFVPQDTTKADSAGNNSFTIESGGLKLQETIIPQKNKQGTVIGNRINYNVVAKPTGQTNTKETGQTTVKATKKTDTKADTKTQTVTKAGFSVPEWLWLIPVALAVLAGFLLYKRYKKLKKLI